MVTTAQSVSDIIRPEHPLYLKRDMLLALPKRQRSSFIRYQGQLYQPAPLWHLIMGIQLHHFIFLVQKYKKNWKSLRDSEKTFTFAPHLRKRAG
jgi:DNA-binding helix-hairpin-helix protein with protein kinase domain